MNKYPCRTGGEMATHWITARHKGIVHTLSMSGWARTLCVAKSYFRRLYWEAKNDEKSDQDTIDSIYNGRFIRPKSRANVVTEAYLLNKEDILCRELKPLFNKFLFPDCRSRGHGIIV